MELNAVLTKVRKLIERAEHPSTPEAEAASCREAADKLMLSYAITEAALEDSRPPEVRGRPETMEIVLAPYETGLAGWIGRLAELTASFTRCRVRLFTRYDSDAGAWAATVYGFESDLRYFEVLYTTLRLHMLGVLAPGLNREESLDVNAYRLHEAGWNWLQIASLYGWRKLDPYAVREGYEAGTVSPDLWAKYEAGKAEVWRNRETGETRSNWQVGSGVKRSYYREIERRGETATKIAAGGTATFRRSAAQGYVTRIGQRLRDAERSRAGTGEVELASRAQRLEDFWREANADLYEEVEVQDSPPRGRPRAYKPLPFNEAAYRAGAAHADSASLSPGVASPGSGGAAKGSLR